MFELLIVRHGQTDWNVERRVMGDKPIPLNNTGRSEARALSKSLKDIPIDAIYSSPLKRTMQTAQIIMKNRDAIPFAEETGFSEINYGDWVDKPFSEIKELEAYFRDPTVVHPPNGEKIEEVRERAIGAIDRIKSRHEGQRVVAVSHADVIKLILSHYLGLPLSKIQLLRVDNASLSVVHFRDGYPPRVINANCHCDFKKYCNL